MVRFNVTYEIVTEESAIDGDAEEAGFIAENVTLREALDAVQETRTSLCDGISGINLSDYPGRNFRWVTIDNGMEFETGAHESRSLHIPDGVTPSSRARIARLLGVKV